MTSERKLSSTFAKNLKLKNDKKVNLYILNKELMQILFSSCQECQEVYGTNSLLQRLLFIHQSLKTETIGQKSTLILQMDFVDDDEFPN